MYGTHHLKVEQLHYFLFYFKDVVSIADATKKKEYIYEDMKI
jgi:hypothetical protein